MPQEWKNAKCECHISRRTGSSVIIIEVYLISHCAWLSVGSHPANRKPAVNHRPTANGGPVWIQKGMWHC